MSRRRKSDDDFLWKLFWGLVLLGVVCRYWYVSVPILSLIALGLILDGRQKVKRQQARELRARREREQRAWANHWVPLIDRQTGVVTIYSRLDERTADAQRDVLEELTRYGQTCVELAKAEAR